MRSQVVENAELYYRVEADKFNFSRRAARAAEVGAGVGTGILAEGLVLDCCMAAELGQCRNLSTTVSSNLEMLGLEL